MLTIDIELRLEYLLLSELADKFLKGNAKLHDIGKIADSIRRYGFRDPLALDAALNSGAGGIAEGNGRLEALIWMHQQGQGPPAYIKLTEDGDWAVPCVVGGDSTTEDEGIAYSLDHNSLTMAGGTFTALDVSRLYNPVEYQATLEKLAKKKMLPITVDGDDLDLLVKMAKTPTPNEGDDDPPQHNPPEGSPIPLAISLTQDEAFEWTQDKERLGYAMDSRAFREMWKQWRENL